ncbi:MAG: hypothetical protein KatS3mg087_1764 [Patescibacteria group bacterium]|nr:MAG: hypothetical protein KatS3mg087_1764 [Patescibacteria group bacterium]
MKKSQRYSNRSKKKTRELDAQLVKLNELLASEASKEEIDSFASKTNETLKEWIELKKRTIQQYDELHQKYTAQKETEFTKRRSAIDNIDEAIQNRVVKIIYLRKNYLGKKYKNLLLLYQSYKQTNGNKFQTLFDFLDSLRNADPKIDEAFNLLEQGHLVDSVFSEAEIIINALPENITLTDPRIQRVLELEPIIENSRIREYIESQYKQTYEFIKRLSSQDATIKTSDTLVIDQKDDVELVFDLPETEAEEGQAFSIAVSRQPQKGVVRYPTSGDRQTIIQRAKQFYKSKLGISTAPGTVAVETYFDQKTNSTYIVVIPITKVGYGEVPTPKRYYIKDKQTGEIKHVVVDKNEMKPFFCARYKPSGYL